MEFDDNSVNEEENQTEELNQAEELLNETRNELNSKDVVDAALKKSQKQITKAGSKKVKEQVISKAATSALSSLIPILTTAAIVVLILIIVIGLIVFLITMPGLMRDKISLLTDSVSTSFKKIFMNDAEAEVNESDIVNLANYINDMGYDLIGYGFLSPEENNIFPVAEKLESMGYEKREAVDSENQEKIIQYVKPSTGEVFKGMFYAEDGNIYNGSTGKKVENKNEVGEYSKYGITYDENGKITKLDENLIDKSLLNTYAVSDKRIFILRNDDDTFLSKLFASNSNKSYLNKTYSSWTNGLVRVFRSKDFLATEEFLPGVIFGNSNFGEHIEYTGEKKLKLKYSITDKPIEFDTEGWTPRYGLSQDMLISLHLATLAPDLVKTIVETYDTEVQVYLDKATQVQALVKMIDPKSTKINTEENGLMMKDFKVDNDDPENTGRFSEVGLNINDEWFDIDAVTVSKEEAANFFREVDINSPKNCTYNYKGGVANHVRNPESSPENLRNRSLYRWL